ncbi:MAG: serine/threonine protein kinase, partial [Planctomycetes bacterium]|nr:serine/threonine protein kinase [Planctomycetota bacterium]
MAARRWRKIRELLEQAVDMSPAEREKFLSRSCGDDAALQVEVQSLLIGCDDAHSPLDACVVDLYSELIGSQEAPSLVGQQVGPYQLVRFIASGGMGAVYLATSPDSPHRKEVAVKLIRRRTLTPDTLRRFRIERQALAALHHPHIAALLDGGVTDTGLPYLVMEYVDGPPIDKYCDEKRFSTNERLELFRAVCSGVAYAHRNLIVHRDLKPNNILVTSQGIPKLLDFGIAKVLDPHAADQPGETTTRNRILTPEYASPEHIRGDAITTASDVYSLGVILYGLLTGQCPYRFKSRIPHEIERTICEQDPEKPSTTILRTLEALSPDEGPHSTSTPESVSKLRSVTP